MWDKPYHTVTTTMLWNAASDDAGSDNSNSDDTAYDTYGNSASLSDDSDGDGYVLSNYRAVLHLHFENVQSERTV